MNDFNELSNIEIENTEPDNAERSFSKSSKHKILFGVCGGLAEYYKINPLFIRIIFILLNIFTSWSIIFYFLLAVILPYKLPSYLSLKNKAIRNYNDFRMMTGLFLIIIGSYYEVQLMGFMFPLNYFGLNLPLISIALFIVFGIFVFIKSKELSKFDISKKCNRLIFNSNKRVLLGVCGALGLYLNVDVIILRMIWIILSVLTMGAFIVIYFVVGFYMHKGER